MSWLTGTKPKLKQISTLTPGQQQLQGQYEQAAGRGIQTASDYYNRLLSNDSGDYEAFAAPTKREFHEQVIPTLSEQFAGMGSGGLSSSGFRNAALTAGTDLAERLGALRAQLRQSGVQGLQNMSQFALRPTVENIYQPGQPGFAQNVASGFGNAAATVAGGSLFPKAYNAWGSTPVSQGGAI